MFGTFQVVKAVEDEMRTLKYYFKSTRRDEAPRRWAYNPQATQ